MFSFTKESIPNIQIQAWGLKFVLDTFYICATMACVLLYFVVPERAHDITLARGIVACVGIIDAIASSEYV